MTRIPKHPGSGKQESRPQYEAPRVIAYDKMELLEAIGPAVACARWVPGGTDSNSDEYRLGDGYEDW